MSGPAATGPALGDLLRDARRRLGAAGVASPGADAESLAAHVLGVGRGRLAAAAARGERVEPADAARFEALLVRRCVREPLQHLTGRAAFRHLELAVGPGVFVPRPETEVTAGLAIAHAARLVADPPALVTGSAPGPLVLDLCTGSGAIAIAVATEVPAARVVAVELEDPALAWARRNVAALAPGRVQLRAGDAVGAATGVAADLVGRVDVLVANPPYIPTAARPVQQEAAGYDPPAALYGGGADGLDVPRGVVAAAAALLRAGGLLVMEHGDVQGPATRALVAGPRWRQVATIQDLTGRPRVLTAVRVTDSAS